MPIRGLNAFACCAILVAPLACWGGGAADQPSGPDGTTAPFARLSVAPGSATLRVGDTVRLTATPVDAQGTPVTGLPAPSFVSSDGMVASVDAQGLVTGLAQGSAVIRASLTADGTTGTDSATVTVTTAGAGRLIVTTPGISFNPSSATISVGDTVAWEFTGAVHNVTFNGPAPPGGSIPDQNPGSVVERVPADEPAHTSTSDQGVWSSPLLPPGAVFGFTFTQAATFPYHCEPHPFMQARVIVEP